MKNNQTTTVRWVGLLILVASITINIFLGVGSVSAANDGRQIHDNTLAIRELQVEIRHLNSQLERLLDIVTPAMIRGGIK